MLRATVLRSGVILLRATTLPPTTMAPLATLTMVRTVLITGLISSSNLTASLIMLTASLMLLLTANLMLLLTASLMLRPLCD
ncbi:hypothetical protein QBC45DRAFT_410517 [Copromyces sp. CBS 386.78]|nr:hypothetical protein QBC45DRAFT_410517 [Copromyces sp. CBS 386.78]